MAEHAEPAVLGEARGEAAVEPAVHGDAQNQAAEQPVDESADKALKAPTNIAENAR